MSCAVVFFNAAIAALKIVVSILSPMYCIFKSHKMFKTILEYARRNKSIQKTNDVIAEKEKITHKNSITFNNYTYEYVSNSKKYIYIKK